MVDEAKADTDSVSEESTDDEAPAVTPIEVKVIAQTKPTEWNDDKDDIEYDEIILTNEEMDI